MARHLCIVARENSPLYGYLTIAFRDRPAGAPTLDIVLDRRLADTRNGNGGADAVGQDRRQHSAVDEAVHSRGYAIFTGPGGGAPSRQDEAFIERAIGLLADVERRGPLALRFGARRRSVISAILKSAAAVLVIAAILTTILRLGGIGRIADAAAGWTDTAVRRVEGAWGSLRGHPDSPPPRVERASERGASGTSPASPVPPAPVAERSAPVLTPPPAVAPSPAPPAAELPPRVASPGVPATPRAPAAETARAIPREEVNVAETQSLPAFTGLVPHVEMSRQAGPSGSGVVYSVRVADAGGRVVSGAQVWLRGQSANGQLRETRLEDTERAGVYKSGVLPSDLMPPSGLSVRVFFSNMRIEIPIDG
jgi:hypothetical protein